VVTVSSKKVVLVEVEVIVATTVKKLPYTQSPPQHAIRTEQAITPTSVP